MSPGRSPLTGRRGNGPRLPIASLAFVLSLCNCLAAEGTYLENGDFDEPTPQGGLPGWHVKAERAAANPNCRLVSWADNFPGGSTRCLFPGLLPLLPKDMVLVNWAYHGSVGTMGLEAAQRYARHSLELVGCPWYDPTNIRQWAQVLHQARLRGWGGLGLRNYGPPPGTANMPMSYPETETAICGWRVPREGERRWVEVSSAAGDPPPRPPVPGAARRP